MNDFESKLSSLMAKLVAQGDRVVALTLDAVESYFERDPAQAAQVISSDDAIDQVDIEIERASVPLLGMGRTDDHEIRTVLMIVKINNELERIADCAVNIAEVVAHDGRADEVTPPTFRVMANSVVGMLRDANKALANLDTDLAEVVLDSDDTVTQFKQQIVLDAQQKVAKGQFGVQFAFRLHTVVKALERIADHCTNICEQVIYLQTGQVVRHLPQGWTDPSLPA